MYVRMKPEDKNLAPSQWFNIESATDVAKFAYLLVRWAFEHRRSWTTSKGQSVCDSPLVRLEFSDELKAAF